MFRTKRLKSKSLLWLTVLSVILVLTFLTSCELLEIFLEIFQEKNVIVSFKLVDLPSETNSLKVSKVEFFVRKYAKNGPIVLRKLLNTTDKDLVLEISLPTGRYNFEAIGYTSDGKAISYGTVQKEIVEGFNQVEINVVKGKNDVAFVLQIDESVYPDFRVLKIDLNFQSPTESFSKTIDVSDEQNSSRRIQVVIGKLYPEVVKIHATIEVEDSLGKIMILKAEKSIRPNPLWMEICQFELKTEEYKLFPHEILFSQETKEYVSDVDISSDMSFIVAVTSFNGESKGEIAKLVQNATSKTDYKLDKTLSLDYQPSSVHITPDNQYILVLGYTRSLNVYDKNLNLCKTIAEHGYKMDLSKDGKYLAVVGLDGIRLYKLPEFELVWKYNSLYSSLYDVIISEDNKFVICADSYKPLIGIHDLENGKLIKTITFNSNKDGTGVYGVSANVQKNILIAYLSSCSYVVDLISGSIKAKFDFGSKPSPIFEDDYVIMTAVDKLLTIHIPSGKILSESFINSYTARSIRITNDKSIVVSGHWVLRAGQAKLIISRLVKEKVPVLK